MRNHDISVSNFVKENTKLKIQVAEHHLEEPFPMIHIQVKKGITVLQHYFSSTFSVNKQYFFL